MPVELSVPLFAASGVAIGAIITYFGWPHLHVRTYNKTHGNLRVMEIAFILSRRLRLRTLLGKSGPGSQAFGKTGGSLSSTEFVIYLTVKSGNL